MTTHDLGLGKQGEDDHRRIRGVDVALLCAAGRGYLGSRRKGHPVLHKAEAAALLSNTHGSSNILSVRKCKNHLSCILIEKWSL